MGGQAARQFGVWADGYCGRLPLSPTKELARALVGNVESKSTPPDFRLGDIADMTPAAAAHHWIRSIVSVVKMYFSFIPSLR